MVLEENGWRAVAKTHPDNLKSEEVRKEGNQETTGSRNIFTISIKKDISCVYREQCNNELSTEINTIILMNLNA